MDHLARFFAEYGYLGNIDRLYESRYNNIVSHIRKRFGNKLHNVRLDYDAVAKEEECILTSSNRTIPLKADIVDPDTGEWQRTETLMEILYPTSRGYFVLSGIEWALVTLDVSYTTMVKVMPPNNDEDKIQWITNMRTEVLANEYKETRVFMDVNDDIYVNVSTMVSRIEPRNIKSIVRRCIHPYVVYRMLLGPKGDCRRFITDLETWSSCFYMEDIDRIKDYIKKLTEYFMVDGQDRMDASLKRCKASVAHTMKELVDESASHDSNKMSSEKLYSVIHDIIISDFVDHPGISNERKAYMLVHMISKLIWRKLNIVKDDNRDKLIHKKVDPPCFLIERTYVNAVEKVYRDYLEYVEEDKKKKDIIAKKKKTTVCDYMRDDSLDMATMVADNLRKESDSVIKKRLKKRQLQSYYSNSEDSHMQVLSKRSTLDIYCHVRRVRANTGSENTNTDARKLDTDQVGFYCFADTNEGVESGLNKYLALTAIITDDLPEHEVQLMMDGIIEFTEPRNEHYLVFLNGYYYGSTMMDVKAYVRELRRDPETAETYKTVSVSSFPQDPYAIYIYTDKGRLCRPLMLYPEGTIEYLDQFEINDPDHGIAMYDETGKGKYDRDGVTHHELHNTSMMGLSAAMMPFSNHNQAARVTFESSMSKQALCQDVEFKNMITDDTRSLWYAHNELVSTEMSRFFNEGRRRTGANVIVAIMPMGYNMDDALIFKKEAIDRGLFINTRKRYQNIDVHNHTAMPVRTDISKPNMRDIYQDDGLVRMDLPKYRFSDHGVLNEGITVGKKDGVATKMRSKVEHLQKLVNTVANTFHKDMRVSRVIVRGLDDENKSGYINIVATHISKPGVGDKFASRYSQKGVIGAVKNASDLPYLESGLVPDIFFNPHSIPSRMTVGHLMEMLAGKVISTCDKDLCDTLHGFFDGYVDATPFKERNFAELIEALKGQSNVMEIEETMYNPVTGEPMKGKVFVGICHYMALKHYVDDKMFYRTLGPVKYTTMQPTEGKSEGGGLKMSIMDFDALVAHGSLDTIIDKCKREVDPIPCHTCTSCGSVFNSPNIPCILCGCADLVKIDVTNGFRMCVQYLQGAGVNVTVTL
ncbi:DNA-directed RNA polymerase subunit B' [Gaertneriomyces sp. JEL0708]|nr:DNA-directed RNA polymerase subunit B' [Gaertneriomyces sp. JEL0708]